jgi:DNA polymerase-3 subunit gamma/tau
MGVLFEKYRPQTFKDVVGQAEAVKQIRAILKRQWGGRAWWLAGESGVGKTSLARIIAHQGADPFFVEEFDSPAALMEANTQKRIETGMQLYATGKGGRAFIINEAHGLRKPEIRWLLGLLERLPKHVVVVFTTTRESGQLWCDAQTDAAPLLSRCQVIDLACNSRTLGAFALAARKIAQAEGLDGVPAAAYKQLAKDCRGNFRMMLQRIEARQMMKPKSAKKRS